MKLTALSLALALVLPGVAQAQEGKELAEVVFDSIDGAERGYLDMGEFTNFGGDIFTSMDQDEDGKVTLDEFLAWSFGESIIAEEKDRTHAYETAMRVVFAFWDRNAELGNATLVPLFSDEGNFARVDMMKVKLPDPLSTYDYYLCGPRPMVDTLMRDLRKEGVTRTQIHTEAFEFR